MTGGNRLRRLAETHVIGKEQAPLHQESFDAVMLIAIERVLEGTERTVQLLPGPRGLALPRKSRAVLLQQRMQGRLAVALAERREQSLHERQPLLRRSGNGDRPAVSVCWRQPAPQTAVGRSAHPVRTFKPVAKAGQWTDRVPPQWRHPRRRVGFAVVTTSL